MAEFRLFLELERASGVLASIVAKLAQQGLELKSQKLERATEGRGGTLDILAEGENDDIAALAENMAAARGVGRIVRIQRDDQPVFFDGEVIAPAPDAAAEGEDATAGGIERRRSPFDDDDDVDTELDEFLEPEPPDETLDAAARSDAGTRDATDPGDAAASNHGWLESDPEADQPPALHPRAEEDGEGDLPMLGRVDRPEPQENPPKPEEPEVDIPATGWGEEAEDDWDTELEDDPDSDPEPEAEVQADLDDDPQHDGRGDEDEDDDEDDDEEPSEPKSEQASDSEPDPDSESDRSPAEQGTSRSSDPSEAPRNKSGMESTIRRRRRRRR